MLVPGVCDVVLFILDEMLRSVLVEDGDGLGDAILAINRNVYAIEDEQL